MSKCALLISPRATKDCDRFGPDRRYEREIVPPLGFLIVIIILFSSSLRFSLLKQRYSTFSSKKYFKESQEKDKGEKRNKFGHKN